MRKLGLIIAILALAALAACTSTTVTPAPMGSPADEEETVTMTTEPDESIPPTDEEASEGETPMPASEEVEPEPFEPTPTRIGGALSPRLESRLAQLVTVYQNDGAGPARELAASMGIQLEGERVMVIVAVSSEEDVDNATRVIEAAGGTIDGAYADQIQAWVPLSALNFIASEPYVRAVMAPAGAVPAP